MKTEEEMETAELRADVLLLLVQLYSTPLKSNHSAVCGELRLKIAVYQRLLNGTLLPSLHFRLLSEHTSPPKNTQ